ncbi:sigma-70 family RNA polymerase sigma factor [Ideonella livida]|uniref:Sigma-70 family RNA polymerase sigma factor n=1 Tax=Ideonella livida TaxID=2707176 RepID=A0A7C9PGB5_9BURK|nr:sigma-70 family RNA polymerase sigma factor [Ideonella livida]NDY91175.1 sigma-70 family RNA polymerase sigma factor [Ideonella livida]
MISMQGVPSVLIAKNQSWVRKQAQALIRHLPANVERADLIQVGLIAVAQAAVTFQWEGDRDTPEAQEAFVRYARMRVKGAMLDELRQMDFLTRGERRKIKVIQIARERLRSTHGREPSYSLLAVTTGMTAEEISALLQADQMGRHQVTMEDDDPEHGGHLHHPATPQEEVEARVDTGIVLRRLEQFFAELPERERMVIDAYLGVGLTPVEVARSLKVTPSRVSQIYHGVVRRVASHFGHGPAPGKRATDRQRQEDREAFERLMREREAQLAQGGQPAWSALMEKVLKGTGPAEDAPPVPATGPQEAPDMPTVSALPSGAAAAPVRSARVTPKPRRRAAGPATPDAVPATAVPAVPAGQSPDWTPGMGRVGEPEDEVLQVGAGTRWG